MRYLLANPKDVVVSFFHYKHGMSFSPLYEWDEFFEKFMLGELAIYIGTTLTMFLVGGPTKMMTMCSFLSTKT